MEIKISKAEMFNSKAASTDSRPDEIIKRLGIKPGHIIADIGSGGGYFSFRFAKIAVNGMVYAMDIDPKLLAYVDSEAKRMGLKNLTTIRIGESGLGTGIVCDLIFMRNVCHHIPDRQNYFTALRSHLKPEGNITIIEYRKTGGFNFQNLFGHYVPEDVLLSEMENAGYKLKERYDILPAQSFLMFRQI